eukprot:gene5912-4227_t
MATNYYENPFDDDDDACFADVEVEEVFIDETPARSEPMLEMAPSEPRREVAHSASATEPPRVTVRQQVVSATARPGTNRKVFCEPEATESEEDDYDDGDYVVTHSSHNTGTARKGDRTRELRLDEMTQSIWQLRHQMNQVHDSKNTMEEDYEEHIKTLREDLERVNAERNDLLSNQSKLESELRSLRLEKENTAFLYKQEKERNEVLADQVGQLQAELSEVQDTHQRMMEELHESHQEEVARTAAQASRKLVRPPAQRRVPAYVEVEDSEQGNDDEDDENEQDDEDTGNRGYAGNEPQKPHKGPAPPKQVAEKAVKARGKGNPTASSWTIGDDAAPAYIEKTEKEKEAARQKRVKEVERLESLLLEHSRSKDELSSQLTRLENTKIRNAGERQKKAMVEEKLENEEKAIGQIRLQLRSLEALFR